MNPQFIRDDLLIESFLKGQLSEDDREEFLSSYLGDSERMEQLREYLREREIPERFLREELSDEERDAFESLSIADPELFEELQLIERTRQGMKDLAEAGDLPVKRGQSGWPPIFNSPLYAAAASVLLVASLVFSGVTFRDNLILRGERELTRGPLITRVVQLENFRNGSPNTVSQPTSNGWTVLLVDPVLTDFESYRATLQRIVNGTAESVWQIDELPLTSDFQLAVGVPGELLTIGEYEMVIEGRLDGEVEDSALERITGIRVSITSAD